MAMRGRPRNFDRTHVLQQAMMAFWAQGYEGTSMSDLIEVMGLSSPSIYAAFSSKENLFREAIALYRQTEGGRIWTATMAAPTAKQAVETMLFTSAEEFTQPDRPKGCLITLGTLQSSKDCQAISTELKKYRAETRDLLILKLEKAAAAGELLIGQDWHSIATYFITIQQGMSIQARDGASRQTLLQVARNAMLSWGILVSPAILTTG